MILHKLIYRYLKCGDDAGFYLLQALDTVRWLEKAGIPLGPDTTVLDLGCGHGFIGGELIKKGCAVTFADEKNEVAPQYGEVDYHTVDIEKDDLGKLGSYDLVICSNVLEHIPQPEQLIGSIERVLKARGKLYLSWTNWLSPWGGHDYSPFHYLGSRHGHLVFDRVIGGRRTHTPYVSLFPVSIARALKLSRKNQRLKILCVVPRYYATLSFITRIPILREFLTLNCVILLERITNQDTRIDSQEGTHSIRG